jgi:peroxiredoxin
MPGLADLIQKQGAFDERGVKPIVVVTNPLRQAQEMVEIVGLPYPLYSDPEYQLFGAFQTGWAAGPPMPAWVVVDGEGTIRYVWRLASTGDIGSYIEAEGILAEIDRIFA